MEFKYTIRDYRKTDQSSIAAIYHENTQEIARKHAEAVANEAYMNQGSVQVAEDDKGVFAYAMIKARQGKVELQVTYCANRIKAPKADEIRGELIAKTGMRIKIAPADDAIIKMRNQTNLSAAIKAAEPITKAKKNRYNSRRKPVMPKYGFAKD